MVGLRDVATIVSLVSGLGFMLIGVCGIVRLPDAYQRLHASSKCSTLGLLGLLTGAAIHIGTPESVMKAVATAFVNLRSHERVLPQKFAERIHGPLYAIAGVGNPARFAHSLIGLGLDPVVRAFTDHHHLVSKISRSRLMR